MLYKIRYLTKKDEEMNKRSLHFVIITREKVLVPRALPTLPNGLATLTPARPDCNGNGPVPAHFFTVLQPGFLAHACSMPACLHRNFEGNLKEHLFGQKKDWKQGKSRSKSGSTKKFLLVKS